MSSMQVTASAEATCDGCHTLADPSCMAQLRCDVPGTLHVHVRPMAGCRGQRQPHWVTGGSSRPASQIC